MKCRRINHWTSFFVRDGVLPLLGFIFPLVDIKVVAVVIKVVVAVMAVVGGRVLCAVFGFGVIVGLVVVGLVVVGLVVVGLVAVVVSGVVATSSLRNKVLKIDFFGSATSKNIRNNSKL